VVLPQAVRIMLPPLTSLGVSLIKHSAIVSVIAIFDLANEARNVIADTFLTFEIWLTAAAIYLAVTTSLSLLVSRLETRFARGT
jgi:polar amino acid transport system permease protein